jgi:hypothetical protein
MIIEQGPPGATGVKSLQYVGDDGLGEADYISSGLNQLSKPVVALAAGAFLFGWLMGRSRIVRTSLAVGAGALAIKYFTK